MPPQSPEARRRDRKNAADVSWERTADRAARTAPARAAMYAKLAREVDPDGTMTPAARALAIQSARTAHALRMVAARRTGTRRAARELGTEPTQETSEAGPATGPAAATTTAEVMRGPRDDNKDSTSSARTA